MLSIRSFFIFILFQIFIFSIPNNINSHFSRSPTKYENDGLKFYTFFTDFRCGSTKECSSIDDFNVGLGTSLKISSGDEIFSIMLNLSADFNNKFLLDFYRKNTQTLDNRNMLLPLRYSNKLLEKGLNLGTYNNKSSSLMNNIQILFNNSNIVSELAVSIGNERTFSPKLDFSIKSDNLMMDSGKMVLERIMFVTGINLVAYFDENLRIMLNPGIGAQMTDSADLSQMNVKNYVPYVLIFDKLSNMAKNGDFTEFINGFEVFYMTELDMFFDVDNLSLFTYNTFYFPFTIGRSSNLLEVPVTPVPEYRRGNMEHYFVGHHHFGIKIFDFITLRVSTDSYFYNLSSLGTNTDVFSFGNSFSFSIGIDLSFKNTHSYSHSQQNKISKVLFNEFVKKNER